VRSPLICSRCGTASPFNDTAENVLESGLLEHYALMLRRLRTFAPAFGRLHPKIASHLAGRDGTFADPYVERLMEAFCFTVERTNVKRDRTISTLVEQLLDSLYPDDAGPTPSISVARIWPDPASPALASGRRLPRGTRLRARIPEGEKTACQFVTGQDVVAWPLELVDANLTGIPLDIPLLAHLVPGTRTVKGALRLRLRTTNGMPVSSLVGLDRLPVYIAEEESVASHLFELLHVASFASIIGGPDQFGDSATPGKPLSVVSTDALVHEGLEPGQGLLPLSLSSQHGRNLLREYFAAASRFYFFALTGLESAFRRISGEEVEIVVLLDRPTDELAPLVNAGSLALYCTPVINLFRRHTDRNVLPERSTEGKLGVSRLVPLDYEIFSVERILGRPEVNAPARVFRPLYQSLNSDAGIYGRYFAARREPRLLSDAAHRNGTRSAYTGTDVFVTLVDQHALPSREDDAIRHVSADVWVTNRDLPLLVPRDGVDDLDVDENEGIASVGLIRPPSAPQSSPDEARWIMRLIHELNFDHLPFGEMDHRSGARALRDLLGLFLADDEAESGRQIQGIVGAHTQPISEVLPGNGPLVVGRGTGCVLTVDEDRFSGHSPYLPGLILEHWFTRYVAINCLSRVELHSMQRGLIMRWPTRMGHRADGTWASETAFPGGRNDDPSASASTTQAEDRITDQAVQWPDEPWRYGFLPLLRRLGSDPAVDPIGTAALPQHEPFHLGQQPSLAFAPREVVSIDEVDGRLMIRLFGLGLLGPNGPLPLHITEIARERKEHRQDATLADFLDIFHHRLLTQFYRTWASAEAAVSLDRPEQETFSVYAASLAGHRVEEIRRDALSAHARLSAGPHLVREARNPEALRATLAHYFGVPVKIEEFIFHWIERAPQDVTRMGEPTTGVLLGVNAFLGTMVPDRQCKFRIVIGPLDFEDYQRFTPRGTDLIKLVEWVRVFTGRELTWELELQIKPESAPVAVMSGPQQLGWSAWLGQPPADKPITGMVFEPEAYMKQIQERMSR
jgi:type VI secretion system protein ImpG